ncbi:NAD-dependent malic enzyme [Candidatus Poribacteria bacterium]|jgi:malate dehydrogenase (oxaloacetate-decarboxylating)|nr:NAD-dependent malic enzyme [Candidatus Poribacteria bacterium]MBT7805579.1 NAD-dependent malic enzyme [Candidatus Poribacteria bacterium]
MRNRLTFDIDTREARTTLRGYALLRDPLANKGTAFSEDERVRFGLDGLLPMRELTLEEQMDRLAENYARTTDDLARYVFLRALQDRNETLFYAFVLSRLEELAPIVYTPTVGTAVERFSHIYRRPRGLFLNPNNISRCAEILREYPYSDGLRLIVATDSEGILGIGDQGTGGMGIPVGKLSLYVLGAGIHPSACLPIVLDVGTDNQELLDDSAYLGWRHERLRDGDYFAFVEAFVEGLRAALPHVLLQWEDLSKQNAFSVLDLYRSELPSFNDDIQGTGAVVLGGVLAALRLTGQQMRDQRLVVLGAGAGGVGVTRQLHAGLVHAGLSETEARERLYTLDSRGLVMDDRATMEPYKQAFARARGDVAGWSLEDPDRVSLIDVIRNARPTAIIGMSGQPGVFDETIVRAACANLDRPLIFPLSNPTAKAEGKPEDILRWSAGRAVVATGSPFEPVQYDGSQRHIGQGNNVFVFPGVGLGALVVGAREITDGMLTAASTALFDAVSSADLDRGSVYPSMARLREVTVDVATAVAAAAIEAGVADAPDEPVEDAVRSAMWTPEYYQHIAV